MIDIPEEIKTPSVLVESRTFLVKLAETDEEVRQAQRLRFTVFNQDQHRGLSSSEKQMMDRDEFDKYCIHLLVIKKNSGEVIGTYRAQLGSIAKDSLGFYSAREYAITGLEGKEDKCLELGRSCVSSRYRGGAAITLLWSAIAKLLIRSRMGYMMGCVSLDEDDPGTAWRLYDHFKAVGMVHPSIKATPKEEFRLSLPGPLSSENGVQDLTLDPVLPPLFKAYIRLGAKICGEPALDREFGTIDFFILVDVSQIPQRYIRHFKYRKS
ncbi:MAG: GNAT family N-acetyltransferase [Candidatus Omnitrophica bacterium]|jgi:putative hemolysin|nr:GNAT family N-acetyltransferase [Candidatus Omnitrophota bacterium]MDD4012817.1 GNAT family N-acetyltransferase [Candidatus Omnitrophota bacterium]